MITLATLMYEIALTRIFSVTMSYHFAFVAISVALFGLTAGALLVHLFPARFRNEVVTAKLVRYSLLFSVSLALCFVVQLSIRFDPEASAASALSIVAICAVVAIPFVFSGVVVCLALTRFPLQVNRLYATDLVGAATGCVLVVVFFLVLDGPSLVIAIGALAAVGALLFASAPRRRRGVLPAALAVIWLGGFALLNGYAHAQGDPLLRIKWAKGEADPNHAYEKWNTHSRVTVDPIGTGPTTPFSAGMSAEAPPSDPVEQHLMVIDGNASTVLTRYGGDPDETDFLRYNVTNLAHFLRRNADVLVVGAGGGRDVLSALEFEQRSVTGVEINHNILDVTNDVYGDLTGHLDRDPRVAFVADEARSYLARTDRSYDVIQISLIDTWAASAAGAYALTENALYTTEAWDVFFDRLKPGGILSVTRWFTLPNRKEPLETYRTIALASQALKNAGAARPREHVLAYTVHPNGAGASLATVLVSPQQFTPDDVVRLASETARLGFVPVLTPAESADPRVAALVSPDGPDAAVDAFDGDLSPPSDDRPFFFQMASLGTLLNGEAFSGDASAEPVLALVLLALAVLGLTFCCVLLPLLLTTHRTAHRGMSPFYTYFAGIGLGFLFVEIAQLQRLSVFLGHPTYALTVVLFSLLVFSGIGSMVSERLADPSRPARALVPFAALVLTVGAFGALTPAIIDSLAGETTPVRVGAAVAILAPLGLLMGMPFAIGMRAAAVRRDAPTAFLWGINGATSVCASVFGVVIAVFAGISVGYWFGFAAYGLAALSLVVIVRRRPVVERAPDVPEIELRDEVATPA